MKFTKTLASVAAAAVAVSSLAISAFAGTVTSNSAVDAKDNVADGVIKLYEYDKETDTALIDLFAETGVARSDVYGLKVTLDLTADQINGEDWIGGGVGANSESTGWLSTEWGQESGAKPIALAQDGTVTWLSETPVFADDDTYCQLWLQTWGLDVTITAMEVLDKDGNAIAALSDEVAAAEETAAVELANSGKTVIDSGLVRTNIINAWAGDDACVIAEKTAFASAEKVTVTFTVSDYTGTAFKAWLSYADSSWGSQFWGEGNDGNTADSTIVEVTDNGTYTITADLGMVIDAMEFIAVCTDLEAAEGDAIPTISIDSVEIVIGEEDVVPGESEDPDDVEPGETEDPDDVNPGESSGDVESPDTGVAVAVVPAAFAAAALAVSGVVLKKRSK